MITYVELPSSGNAVRLYVTPPAGAASWRVLRRTDAAAFSGPDDTGAAVVATCSIDNVILDDKALVNGTAYAYRIYYRDRGGSWVAQDDAQATPAASWTSDDADPQTVLRDRLQLGLAVEVQRNNLRPQSGKVQVVTAPFAMVDKITFPCVSIHHDSESSSDYAVGDAFGMDALGGLGGWEETTGWLSRVNLNIAAVSLNGDERIALRRAIRRVVQANMPIFYAYGFRNIEFAMQDTESGGGDAAILFMTGGSFGCVAPAFVRTHLDPITAINVVASSEDPALLVLPPIQLAADSAAAGMGSLDPAGLSGSGPAASSASLSDME